MNKAQFTVDKSKCVSCGRCVNVCPGGVLSMEDGGVCVSAAGAGSATLTLGCGGKSLNLPVSVSESSQEEVDRLGDVYKNCGCQVVFTSVEKQEGLLQVRELLKDKTTVMAGPSGVGKSSMMNYLKPEAAMETGAISKKIQRGRHTTRHSELFHLEGSTYVMDTPGFTSLYIDHVEAQDLKNCFAEFEPYEGQCRFNGCVHIHEPDCAVKEALKAGKISRSRYDNYVIFYEELKSQRRY